MREETVAVEQGGLRLDQFLARRYPGYTRAHLKDLILRGGVTVNGAARPPDHRLSGGELVRLRWPEAAWTEVPFEDWVIHEDKDLLALRKPAGLIVHPMGESWVASPEAALADPEPNLAGLLLRHRPKESRSGVSRCGIVHRLDRQTSGVLLVAKNPAAQQSLLVGFRERTIHKVYRAVVLGEVEATTVEAPIGRHPGQRKVKVTPWGRQSSTEFKALAVARGLSLAQAEPRTGRTHQIRAHLALLKHPVLGDPEWFREPERARLKALGLAEPPRMLLHAYQIRFAHPRTGKETRFTAPVPPDFRAYWDEVAKNDRNDR